MYSPPEQRRLLLQLVILFLLGVALGLLTTIDATDGIDEAILKAVQDGLPGGFRHVAAIFNGFLYWAGIPLLCLASVLGLLVLRRFDFAVLFALLVVDSFYTRALKVVFERPRPSGDFTIREVHTDFSFPSGHTMRAMLFFGLWFVVCRYLLPQRAVLPVQAGCVMGVILMALSRVWAGAHWPTDVLGAVIWGAVFLTTLWITRALWQRRATSR